MNIYNVNNEIFVNSNMYQDFIKVNSEIGYLKVRVYAAQGAIPLEGVQILVIGNINNNKVIFFEGYTDSSGMIEKISLPAPPLNADNLESPKKQTYNLLITYLPNNTTQNFKINIYDGICVVQNVNIIPDANLEMDDNNGS